MNKITASNDTERRALINLRELSEITWSNEQKLPEKQVIAIQQNAKKLQNNPKNLNKNRILSFKTRPHTIHHKFDTTNTSLNIPKKAANLTSLNFYDKFKQSYNSFECRSKINSEFDGFVRKIRQEQKNQFQKHKNSNHYVDANKLKNKFKTNSQTYQKLKNYLFQSFKIDGRQVNITKNKYPFQIPGILTKKSVYLTQTKKNHQIFTITQKTDKLFKKVHRYQFDEPQIQSISLQKKNKISKNTFHSQTMELKRSKNQNSTKGKLWLGRPPVKVISIYDQSQQTVE